MRQTILPKYTCHSYFEFYRTYRMHHLRLIQRNVPIGREV